MGQDFTTVRPNSFMLPTQLSFVKWARGCGRVDSLWYGNAEIVPETDRCVFHTVRWIESFASQLEPMLRGSDDPRLVGFAQIHRK